MDSAVSISVGSLAVVLGKLQMPITSGYSRIKTLGTQILAKQIHTLNKRAVEIADRRERYRQLDTLPGCSTGSRSATATASHGARGVDPRLSAFFFDDGEDHLVGIDGPKYELVAWLLHGRGSTDHQKALFIVGSGGIGKTTLAKRVYLEIGGHFGCKASVSVSRKPNLMHILRDCLLQLCHDREFTEHIGEWDEN
nr:unnamed protein product [Digitaria exilis]